MKVYGKNAGISKISGSLQEHRDIDFKDLVHCSDGSCTQPKNAPKLVVRFFKGPHAFRCMQKIHRNFQRKFSFNFQVALFCHSDLSKDHKPFSSHIVSVSSFLGTSIPAFKA